MSKIINPSWTILVSLVQFQILSPKKNKKHTQHVSPPSPLQNLPWFFCSKNQAAGEGNSPQGWFEGPTVGNHHLRPQVRRATLPETTPENGWKTILPFSGAWPIFSDYVILNHFEGVYIMILDPICKELQT